MLLCLLTLTFHADQIQPLSASHEPTCANTMPRLQYRVLGRIPPTSRPTEQENRFVRLYDDTGRKLRFESNEDVFTMVEDERYRRLIESFTLWLWPSLPFIVTVELEVPWSVGLPPGKQQLPLSFQHALCIQLCPSNPRCSARFYDFELCDFSKTCRPGSNDNAWRDHMTARGYDTVVPIFREPRVETMWEKISVLNSSTNSNMDVQRWRIVMFCANCQAARAVADCTHLRDVTKLSTHEQERIVERGRQSELDLEWGKYCPFYSNHILCQDFNYHGPLNGDGDA